MATAATSCTSTSGRLLGGLRVLQGPFYALIDVVVAKVGPKVIIQ